MKILSFDTSNSSLSTALIIDQKILSKNTISENGKQAEMLICEIEKILTQNKIWYQDLDLIATTSGPGSFTGVRIGLSAARGLKIATKLPLILLTSLEVIAYKYRKKHHNIFVAIDAKMDEFFIANFSIENEKLTILLEPQLVSFDLIKNFLPKEPFFLCGSGKKTIAKICQESHEKNPKENKIEFLMEDDEDMVESDSLGLLAHERFIALKNPDANLDPLYLRNAKISERKK